MASSSIPKDDGGAAYFDSHFPEYEPATLEMVRCSFPDCMCDVPDYAFSHHNRKGFCEKYKIFQSVSEHME